MTYRLRCLTGGELRPVRPQNAASDHSISRSIQTMTPFQDVPKQCRKCGHPRSPDTTAFDAACPSCGAIYAKMEAQFRSEAAAADDARAMDQLLKENKAWERAHAHELESVRREQIKGIRLAHLVYLLYILPFGLTGIIGVVIAHVMTSSEGGNWVQTHFRWQISTFWWGVFWAVLLIVLNYVIIRGIAPLVAAKEGAASGVFTFLTASGALATLGIALGLWLLYRVVKGWFYLFRGDAIETRTES